MTEAAVKVAVHRMRRRYREVLRAIVAETVDDEREVDDELRFLMSVLRQ
jgi:RNA polymerase sigma-70 factor (ECF subfamily)